MYPRFCLFRRLFQNFGKPSHLPLNRDCLSQNGYSRDQLECIDPRLAARMVNQLKCLRRRKFSSSKFCQLRVQSPKLPLTACSSKSRKKVGGIHHFSTCQFLHSRFSTLTCFHLRDFEVSAREQFSHFYF